MRLFVMIGTALLLISAVIHNQAVTLAVPNEDYVLLIEDSQREDTQAFEDLQIYLKTDEGIRELLLEDYLVSVVMSEMPYDFSSEALKAQAVAARTFAARMLQSGKHSDCDLCSDPSCCQAYLLERELQNKYDDLYISACEKAANAVKDTRGQVLTYQGELIEAVYYSCSGGTTEPAVAVWGSDVPYLQSVQSPGEEISQKYQSTVRVSFQEFKRILRAENPKVQFSVIPENWIGDVQYSDGGGVLSMTIGGQCFSGTKLRNLFSLNATLFTLRVGNGEMIFSVKGYGHRVGMSQYGAEVMALNGSDYTEILHHYYTGVTIKKLSRTGSGQLILQET